MSFVNNWICKKCGKLMYYSAELCPECDKALTETRRKQKELFGLQAPTDKEIYIDTSISPIEPKTTLDVLKEIREEIRKKKLLYTHPHELAKNVYREAMNNVLAILDKTIAELENR